MGPSKLELEATESRLKRERDHALEVLSVIASGVFPQHGPGGGAQRQLRAIDMQELASAAINRHNLRHS